MRTIKFRAWDTGELNKSIAMIHEVQNCYNSKISKSLGDLLRDERFVVMQFTGLKDKNGQEIYEGDILKIHTEFYNYFSDDDDAHDMDYIGEVVITATRGACIKNPRTYCYLSEEHGKLKQYKPITAMRSEVLGNIHENPELL